MHVKDHQTFETSGALHGGVSHNHIMISARQTLDVIMSRKAKKRIGSINLPLKSKPYSKSVTDRVLNPLLHEL